MKKIKIKVPKVISLHRELICKNMKANKKWGKHSNFADWRNGLREQTLVDKPIIRKLQLHSFECSHFSSKSRKSRGAVSTNDAKDA